MALNIIAMMSLLLSSQSVILFWFDT